MDTDPLLKHVEADEMTLKRYTLIQNGQQFGGIKVCFVIPMVQRQNLGVTIEVHLIGQ
jgi:hypothetical protein